MTLNLTNLNLPEINYQALAGIYWTLRCKQTAYEKLGDWGFYTLHQFPPKDSPQKRHTE